MRLRAELGTELLFLSIIVNTVLIFSAMELCGGDTVALGTEGGE